MSAQFDRELLASINKAGYINVIKLADSLQGSVYKALGKSTNVPVVIKVTNKHLHENRIAVFNGTQFQNIKENILSEASILKYLTEQKDAPKSIVKYCNLLACDFNYYLVMTDGGHNLFDFVKQAHRLLSLGHIHITEWHKVVKCIFKQMVECVAFIHSKRVCHFDISLENFLVNDIDVDVTYTGSHSQITFNQSDIQIVLIDFGLATYFEQQHFDYKSSKFCGKSGYKSPEVVAKQKFDARGCDVWCLGIILFMMVFGFKPWGNACNSDAGFASIMNGDIIRVLESWNIVNVNADLIDLLQSIYQFEDKRIKLNKISQHKWLK